MLHLRSVKALEWHRVLVSLLVMQLVVLLGLFVVLGCCFEWGVGLVLEWVLQ